MKLTDIQINNSTIGKNYKLVNIKPVYEYLDGKRTEKTSSYKYSIVLVDRGYEKLDVKIDGDKQLEVPDDGSLDILLDGLELFLYWYNGSYNLGARATSIRKKG